MKTEVYSWRVSSDLKTGLEREARRLKLSLSAVLDLAAQEWLGKSGEGIGDEAAQQRLHQAADACLGTIAGGNPRRAESARAAVRQRLRRRHAR
jgi:hypothetical protein